MAHSKIMLPSWTAGALSSDHLSLLIAMARRTAHSKPRIVPPVENRLTILSRRMVHLKTVAGHRGLRLRRKGCSPFKIDIKQHKRPEVICQFREFFHISETREYQAPVMARPRPGRRIIVCRRVAPGGWLSGMGGESGWQQVDFNTV